MSRQVHVPTIGVHRSTQEAAGSAKTVGLRDKSCDEDGRLSVDRRAFLTAAATISAAELAAAPAMAQGSSGAEIAAALSRFRATIPSNFDRDYVEHAIIPFFLSSVYGGERPVLPMIDLALSKENALPHDLWGLIYEDWKPTPTDGVTVFLQGLDRRGENNLRKRIYFSALTPDLYRPMYGAKVVGFFDQLFQPQYAGKPFMRHYLDYYFDIYWDLHVGVRGEAIPQQVREIGESFNTVLAYRNPMQPNVHENYMTVRRLLPQLKAWIDDRVNDVASGKVANPEKTFVYYWLKNAGNGEHFSKKDVVFEVFHNFVAFSQWGNTIHGIMSRLMETGGDADVRAAFTRTMGGDFDSRGSAPYSPLEMLVMELFRAITPNGGSISAIGDVRTSAYGASPYQQLGLDFERHAYMSTPHLAANNDPALWSNPRKFDPDRYKTVPTSAEVDEARCKQIGFARCPFEITTLPVADGRKVGLANSGFGTVFAVADGKPLPVCDHAGFAPFGFGYRRCPGEQLTIDVFADFLRKVARDRITFSKLDIPNPGKVPIGPNTVIDDNIAFARSA
jgi:cytochrome P450